MFVARIGCRSCRDPSWVSGRPPSVPEGPSPAWSHSASVFVGKLQHKCVICTKTTTQITTLCSKYFFRNVLTESDGVGVAIRHGFQVVLHPCLQILHLDFPNRVTNCLSGCSHSASVFRMKITTQMRYFYENYYTNHYPMQQV